MNDDLDPYVRTEYRTFLRARWRARLWVVVLVATLVLSSYCTWFVGTGAGGVVWLAIGFCAYRWKLTPAVDDLTRAATRIRKTHEARRDGDESPLDPPTAAQ